MNRICRTRAGVLSHHLAPLVLETSVGMEASWLAILGREDLEDVE